MSFRPGTEIKRIRCFTWIFDPGMKFRPGAEDRDEIVTVWANSPRDHVNTKSQMTRHRRKTHPGMKLVLSCKQHLS